MDVKSFSPGVGCVGKERSLYAAGCKEGAVTEERRGEMCAKRRKIRGRREKEGCRKEVREGKQERKVGVIQRKERRVNYTNRLSNG